MAPARQRRGVPTLALAGVLLAAAAIWVAVAVASIARSPDLGGILTGVFGGLFTALLFAAAGSWALLALLRPARAKPVDETKAAELAGLVGDALGELETVRAETARRIGARAGVLVPLGVVAGLVVWILGLGGEDGGDVGDLLALTFGGGAIGYFWASHRLSEAYRSRYKAHVLPALAAQFGALTYRPAVMPDLGELRRRRIFREFDNAKAEDELVGERHGLPVRIVELTLTIRSGKHTRTVFDGLITELTLPRGLRGTTAVIADAGLFGNLADRLRGSGAERVRLEDPRFEEHYEVYGTDQIGARALLTPAFMERFLALAELPGFNRPLALAEDAQLTVIMQKASGRDLFEPPSYRQPAASRHALVELHEDIAAVMALADAVIGLDHLASARARDAGGSAGGP